MVRYAVLLALTCVHVAHAGAQTYPPLPPAIRIGDAGDSVPTRWSTTWTAPLLGSDVQHAYIPRALDWPSRPGVAAAKPRTGTGILIGAAVGAALGYVIGAYGIDSSDCSDCVARKLGLVGGGIIGAVTGGLLGSRAGSGASTTARLRPVIGISPRRRRGATCSRSSSPRSPPPL